MFTSAIIIILLIQNAKQVYMQKEERSWFCIYSTSEVSATIIPESCSESSNKICYASFWSPQNVTTNSRILACRNFYQLNTLLTMENVDNVTLIGQPNGTRFNCTQYLNTGLELIRVRNILLKDITFSHCGAVHIKNKTKDQFQVITSAVYAYRATEINIQNVDFTHGNGTGIVLLNSYGSVIECLFENNYARTGKHNDYHDLNNGGGGLHVEIDDSLSDYANIELVVERCKFFNNTATTNETYKYQPCKNEELVRLGRGGGGLGIFLRGQHSTAQVSIVINNTEIQNNSALWGGGIFLIYCNPVGVTEVVVQNVIFIDNWSSQKGGGGMDIGFKTSATKGKENKSAKNSFLCKNCTFEKNRAYFGGGAAIYSRETGNIVNNSISFVNCTWHHNIAHYGAALDMAPQLIETPKMRNSLNIHLTDVILEDNYIFTHDNKDHSNNFECNLNHNTYGKGVVMVTGMTIHFKGSIVFAHNNGSGIHAISTILDFASEAKAEFIENNGITGAAITLVGFSAIQVHHNVTIDMIKNRASGRGGAIYHYSIDKHDYIFSHSCFIQIEPKSPDFGTPCNKTTGVVFNFSGNRAGTVSKTIHDGNAIFVTSLQPCALYCNGFNSNITNDIFWCIGEFHFDESVEDAVSTSAGCLIPTNNGDVLEVIPGSILHLPFFSHNDFQKEVRAIYHINSNTDDISIDEGNVFTSVKDIVVKGKPGSEGKITVTNIDLREASISFRVKLNHCPPFYVFNETEGKCNCFLRDNDVEHENSYSCGSPQYKTRLRHGFWAGIKDSSLEGVNLMYGYCPSSYCYKGKEGIRYHELPMRIDQLDEEICGKTRTGVLCGMCRSNFSAHFHSNSLRCGTEETCKYGWFLYLLSEILPLTVVFTFVIVFQISFTSGALTGFILFAQVYISLFSVGKSFIYYPTPVYYLLEGIVVFYKVFNIDFLGLSSLSFCMWNGATVIQMLAFKFVTVAFGLCLVFITVFVMNRCISFSKRIHSSEGYSIIHALSAFLVMVYTQCTTVSIEMLRLTNVYTLNGTYNKVLYYQGDIDAFSDRHKPFAALAIIALLSITTISPLLLVYYPLCYKVSALLKLHDTKIYQVLSRLFPIYKLKPMFDSFQGCFKDNCRHFAGLYFVYRVSLLLATLAPRVVQSYIIIEIELILMLTVHVVCWPYIKKAHNIIDTLIFSNLSVINVISLFNSYYGKFGVYKSTIDALASVQVCLIYGPFLYLCGYVTMQIVRTIKEKKVKMSVPQRLHDDLILNKLDDMVEDDEPLNYTDYSDSSSH